MKLTKPDDCSCVTPKFKATDEEIQHSTMMTYIVVTLCFLAFVVTASDMWNCVTVTLASIAVVVFGVRTLMYVDKTTSWY